MIQLIVFDFVNYHFIYRRRRTDPKGKIYFRTKSLSLKVKISKRNRRDKTRKLQNKLETRF